MQFDDYAALGAYHAKTSDHVSLPGISPTGWRWLQDGAWLDRADELAPNTAYPAQAEHETGHPTLHR
jgi:hypothetical protein